MQYHSQRWTHYAETKSWNSYKDVEQKTLIHCLSAVKGNLCRLFALQNNITYCAKVRALTNCEVVQKKYIWILLSHMHSHLIKLDIRSANWAFCFSHSLTHKYAHIHTNLDSFVIISHQPANTDTAFINLILFVNCI